MEVLDGDLFDGVGVAGWWISLCCAALCRAVLCFAVCHAHARLICLALWSHVRVPASQPASQHVLRISDDEFLLSLLLLVFLGVFFSSLSLSDGTQTLGRPILLPTVSALVGRSLVAWLLYTCVLDGDEMATGEMPNPT